MSPDGRQEGPLREHTRVTVERGVPIRLRDGTATSCDVYRPDTDGPVPAILHRTPYNKRFPGVGYQALDPMRAAASGFAAVVQDVRGRYASEGVFDPYVQEIDDGHDSIEWCAAQSWCDGNVGTIGASYAGINQFLAAAARPPHLRCIVPMLASSDLYEGWTYQGGVLAWGFMAAWVLPMLASEQARTPELADRLREAVDALSTQLQLRDPVSLPLVSELAPYFLDWVAHPSRDAYWRRVGIQDRYAEIDVPSLHVGGWYDIFAPGTIRNFAALSAGDAAGRHRLIMGPWPHTMPTSTAAGVVDFGLASGEYPMPLAYDLEAEYLRFFDRWLRPDRPPASAESPPARIFVMGTNVWRDEMAWPPAGTAVTPLFLGSGGDARSSAGDGTLSWSAGPAGTDAFRHDPARPVPTVGGGLCCYPAQLPPGPFDQSAVEARDDVLVYRSARLENDVEVTGLVTLELWASTSAADTDFTAKLVDLAPSGLALNLTDGVLRGRYRQGTDQERPLTPGAVVPWTIEIGVTSRVVAAGHRIVLEVASSNFPRFAVNDNTLDGSGPVIADQVVHHGGDRPSRLLLPIVSRTVGGDG